MMLYHRHMIDPFERALDYMLYELCLMKIYHIHLVTDLHLVSGHVCIEHSPFKNH